MALRLLLLVGLVLPPWLTPPAAWAGPVSWQEVQATEEGRQWWDEGSLRVGPTGLLSVLSRFQPADAGDGNEGRRRNLGDLYVMEIDCGQRLFRDTSVNGLPRWGAEWQAVAGDGLIEAVVDESCAAAGLQPLA